VTATFTDVGDQLDPDAPVPLYAQLAAILRGQIERGEIAGRVPSAVQLGRRFGCSRDTALHALEIVKGEGLVTTVHGVGTFTVPQQD
jgi:GntR family transcriptional regulator